MSRRGDAVPGQIVCTRCSTPLDAPTATGLCEACALATQAEQPPAAGPPAPDTPQAQADGTPAGENPNPFAPTHTGPGDAPTASGPPAPRGDLPDDPEGFALLRRLGSGGMGDVYLAHEAATNRFVAVKFMRYPGNAQLLERFRLEFRALANLAHPHSVRVHAYRLEGPAPFYAMELLEGGSVADRLKNGPLATPDAVELIRKVGLAVQALHDTREHGCLNGVIHRDIKPGNILLTKGGEPKLADFGLVKYLDADTITHTLQEVGTAQYMPPEQFNRANGEVGYPADVYGLGATLYHLLTGCPPFTGETVFDVRDAVLGASPVRVRALRPEVPLELEAVVLKCLAKDPAERYQTVAELLKALADPPADSAPRYTRGYRLRLWLKRHSRALALSAVVAVALGAAAAALWPPRDPEEGFRKTVRAGETALVVPERGVPPHLPQNWLFNPLPIAESTAAGGAAAFESLQPALLAFLRDPGTDRFKVRANLLVLRSDLVPAGAPLRDADFFGGGGALFFGHARVPGAGGEVHTFLTAQYHECLPPGLVKKGVKASLDVSCAALVVRNGAVPELVTFQPFAQVPFAPVPRLPGNWRGLGAEVSPGGAKVYWHPDPDGPGELAADVTAEQIAAHYAEVTRELNKRYPDLKVPKPAWAPRGAFGVHGNPSALAFKNVTVSPLK